MGTSEEGLRAVYLTLSHMLQYGHIQVEILPKESRVSITARAREHRIVGACGTSREVYNAENLMHLVDVFC